MSDEYLNDPHTGKSAWDIAVASNERAASELPAPVGSPTPKTDAFASKLRGLGTGYYQALGFARLLEMDNNRLRAALRQFVAAENSFRAHATIVPYPGPAGDMMADAYEHACAVLANNDSSDRAK